MKTYIALTIGPIYKTLSSAKKTGELWAASYLFSYIMKEIVKEFKDKKEHILLPAIKEELFTNPKSEKYQGAGFFPDRFIFEKSEEDELEKLEHTITNVLDRLANNIYQHFEKSLKETQSHISRLQKDETKKEMLKFYTDRFESLKQVRNKEEIANFIKEYFQIYFIEKEAKTPVKELSDYLDMLELQQRVIPKESVNYLSVFMKNVNGSFLRKDAFGTTKGTFNSLPLIATKGLQENTAEDFDESLDDTQIYKVLEKSKNFQNYHKYIAIVQADGDNIGALVSDFGDKEQQQFSQKLLAFASSANEIIKEYGGSVVYAGGDDLLFFAPVVNGDSYIFQLLEKIREKFHDIFQEEIETSLKQNADKLPSISFGVSISYYKYPLYEALQEAQRQLFEIAKSGTKDNIAVKLLNHSGKYVETTLHQSANSHQEFKKLIELFLSIDEKKDILSSFHHTVRKFEDVLKAISTDEKAIRNFFENNYNDAHQEIYKEFMVHLVEYIVIVFGEEPDRDKAIKRLYTTLKLIKFLKGGEV